MTLDIATRAAFRDEALGIPARRGVMLSWSVSGNGTIDTAHGARIRVARRASALGPGGDLVWEAVGVTGSVVRYAGPAPASREGLWWQVELRDRTGAPVVSPSAYFEVGLENEADWSAQWISSPLPTLRREQWNPASLLRHEFAVDGAPSTARIYATALGVYRLWVNATEVTSTALLRPGWTDYTQRVLHQTYDVAGILRDGTNVIAVELAPGWYAGRLGLQREPEFYGAQPAVRIQVEVAGQVVSRTGQSWQWSHGDILASDLLTGEIQDLRLGRPGWDDTGFDDAEWQPAVVRDDISVTVSPQPHASPLVADTRDGTLVRAHARGPAVFDFGQNIIGWTRVSTRTLPRADVVVRHGEVLTGDDLIWRDNLRGAFQEDRYTTGDSDNHVLEPRHTQHGFRYAEVWGLAPEHEYRALVVPDDFRIEAVAIEGVRPVGRFSCSDEALTAVSSMVEWTVRDNFLEVITDCPQRDERLGWLGDAGVIAQTAAYYFDTAAFMGKFVGDAADAQTVSGAILSYVPPVPPGITTDGAPGWADGYVRLVHTLTQRYGDVVTAEEHIDHIARYLAWVDAENPDGIRTRGVGSDFSDWLSLPENPDEPPHPGYAYTGARSTSSKRVVATAHTIHSFDQFADLARLLGRDDEEERAQKRAAQIRAAYRANFVDERGWIEGDTQAVYAQALGYGILTGDDATRAANRLAEKVRELGHVTVGIHGSEHILPVLARTGHVDLMEMLLVRENMPSWKHMHAMGATTVWEKWDGILADGTRSTAEMNSFNHCALGAIGGFLFEGVAGLDVRGVIENGRVVVAPFYPESLSWARAEHDSPAGPTSSAWERAGALIHHDITIAPGLTAQYQAPTGYQVVSGETSLASGDHRVTVRRATS